MSTEYINLIGTVTIAPALTNERMGAIPLLGELVFDENSRLLYVGDGKTVGGIRVGGDIETINADIKAVMDALEQEIVNRKAGDEDLSEQIATLRTYTDNLVSQLRDAMTILLQTETAERKDADTALDNKLSTESTERKESDAALQANIDGETAERKTQDGILLNLIETESTERKASDAANVVLINDEVTAREEADTAIRSELSTESDERKAGDLCLHQSIVAEVQSRTDADTALGERIDGVINDIENEEASRVAADDVLDARIDALTTTSNQNVAQEKSERVAADTALGLRIDNAFTEINQVNDTLTTAIAGVNANVTAESVERKAADAALSSLIDDESALRISHDEQLQENIDNLEVKLVAEETARKAMDDTLAERINDIIGGDGSSIRELSERLTAEETARIDGDTRLNSRISAENTVIERKISDEVTARTEADTALGERIDDLTKADVGLGNVDNTSDLNKPVSLATQAALNLKADADIVYADMDSLRTDIGIRARRSEISEVGFSGLYADLLNKPVIPAAQIPADWSATSGVSRVLNKPTTIAGYGITDAVNVNQVGANNGLATLGPDGKIISSQLPPITIKETFVVNSQAEMLALTVQTGDMAVRPDIPATFVCNGQAPSTTMAGWTELLSKSSAVESVNNKVGVVVITKADVGLSNVNNTTDLSKPISTATQAALNLKADAQWVADELSITNNEVSRKFNRTGESQVEVSSGGNFARVTPTGLQFVGPDHSVLLNRPIIGSYTIALPSEDGSLFVDTVGTTLKVRREGQWIDLDIPVTSVNGRTGAVVVNKTDVGLSNVNNTTDANKPISTATQTALNNKQDKYANQPVNFVLAGPVSGADAVPVFRKLEISDIPTLTSLYAQANRTVSAGAGLTGGGTLDADRTIALTAQSLTSLTRADSSLQPAAIGTTVQPFNSNLTLWAAIQPSSKAGSGAIGSSGLTMTSAALLGRSATGTGVIESISLGNGLSLANGTLDTTNKGTVTSVGLNSLSTGLNVSNSPITSNGLINISLNQNLDLWSAINPSTKAETEALNDYLPLSGGSIAGNLSVANQITAPIFILTSSNLNQYRFRMTPDLNFAYIQAGRPLSDATPNSGGKLRFTGWLGSTADEIRFDAVSFNRGGNEIVDVRGAIFTGPVVSKQQVITLASGSTNASSDNLNRIMRRSTTAAVTFNITAGTGTIGDTMVIMNAAASGDITLSKQNGVSVYRNGVATGTTATVIRPFTTVTLYCIGTNTWSYEQVV